MLVEFGISLIVVKHILIDLTFWSVGSQGIQQNKIYAKICLVTKVQHVIGNENVLSTLWILEGKIKHAASPSQAHMQEQNTWQQWVLSLNSVWDAGVFCL